MLNYIQIHKKECVNMLPSISRFPFLILGEIRKKDTAGTPKNPYIIIVTTSKVNLVMDDAFHKYWKAHDGKDAKPEKIFELNRSKLPPAIKERILSDEVSILVYDGPDLTHRIN